jgi:transcription-repair coupling factor (superfamily II helicase)
MAEEAVCELRGEPLPERIEPQLELGFDASIPEDYIPDINQRLNMYQKLTSAGQEQKLKLYRQEMIDRYGKLPQSVKNLLEILNLRLWAQKLYIIKMQRKAEQVKLTFSPATPISTDELLKQIRGWGARARLVPEHSLLFKLKGLKEEEICPQLRQLLEPFMTKSDQ